jgi:hypothetical protein
MKSSQTAFVVGVIVATEMTIAEWCPAGSFMRSLLIAPLIPGYFVGFVLGKQGEYRVIGFLSAWFVNSAWYWLIWWALQIEKNLYEHSEPLVRF